MEIVFWIYFLFTACYAVSAATHGGYSFRKRLGYILFSPFCLPFILLVLVLLCAGLVFGLLTGENKDGV